MAAFYWLLRQLSEYWSIQTTLGSLQYYIVLNIRRENNCDYNRIQYWLFHLIISFYTQWRNLFFFLMFQCLFYVIFKACETKLELIRVNDWSTNFCSTIYPPFIGYLKPKHTLDWRISLYFRVNIVLIFLRLTKIPHIQQVNS